MILGWVLFGPVSARAYDYGNPGRYGSDLQSSMVTVENAPWLFGVGLGYAFIQNSPIITQTTTNFFSVFGFTDDQVVTTATGRVKNSFAAQGYVYRRFMPRLSLGIEGQFNVNHKIDAVIQNAPIFGAEYITSDEQILIVTPMVRIDSNWMGRCRFYAAGGAGWASIDRTNLAHYTFILISDDGSELIDVGFAQDSRRDYVATNAGGGLEYALSDNGSIAFDVRFQTIYSRPDPHHFLTPTARFNYYF